MKHVASVSFTASIGLMAIFAVDFIDMIFIAMLGNQALAAAVGYAGTILFFTTSISIGLSIAAGALVARSLGQRKPELAREYATSVMMVALLVALATVVFVWFQLDNLLSFLGADTETKQLASEYLKIIIPSMPLLTGAMISTAVLRAHGDAKRAMWATLIGGLVNAVLDPILIFTFGLDLQGAALASVIARATMLVAAARPAIQLYNGFCLPSPSKMGNLIKRDINRVSSIAGPAVLTNIATPVGSAIVIREMAHYGTDIIAGMAIIARLTPVSFALVFALSGAIGPILGQNFGAGLFERVKETFKSSLLFTLAYVLLIATLLYLIRQPIASLFNAKGDTILLLSLFCGPLALAFFFNGVIFIANATFNNLGYPLYSTMINWGRHTLGTLPFVLAGSALWGAGGILIGQAIGGLVFAIIAVVLAWRVINKQITQAEEHTNSSLGTTPKEEPFKKEERLQVVHSRRH